MKVSLFLVSLVSTLMVLGEVDVYEFQMRLRVPRIYDNTTSQGYRKWQSQLIKGWMYVDYNVDDTAPVVSFSNCVNKTHKINGNNVTYLCEKERSDEVVRRWVCMGSNKKSEFKYGSCFFYADFEPSYNVGDDEPDNSLLLYFGGRGIVKKVSVFCNKVKLWKGNCVGTMGCGCRAYGHVSPTRVLGYFGPIWDWVVDVAAIPEGRWTARYKYSK